MVKQKARKTSRVYNFYRWLMLIKVILDLIWILILLENSLSKNHIGIIFQEEVTLLLPSHKTVINVHTNMHSCVLWSQYSQCSFRSMLSWSVAFSDWIYMWRLYDTLCDRTILDISMIKVWTQRNVVSMQKCADYVDYMEK